METEPRKVKIRRFVAYPVVLLLALILGACLYWMWLMAAPPDIKLASDAEVEAAIDPTLRSIKTSIGGSEQGWEEMKDAAHSLSGPPNSGIAMGNRSAAALERTYESANATVLSKLKTALSLTPWRTTENSLRTPHSSSPSTFKDISWLMLFLDRRIELALFDHDSKKAAEALKLRLKTNLAFLQSETRLDQYFRSVYWLDENADVLDRAINECNFSEKELQEMLILIPSPVTQNSGLERAASRFLREVYIPQIRTPSAVLQINFYDLPLSGGNLNVVRSVREGSGRLAEFLAATRQEPEPVPGPIAKLMTERQSEMPYMDLHVPGLGGKPERLIFAHWVRRTPNSLGIFASPDRVLVAHWGVNLETLAQSLHEQRWRLDTMRLRLALQIFFVRHKRYPRILEELVTDKILERDWSAGRTYTYEPDERRLTSKSYGKVSFGAQPKVR